MFLCIDARLAVVQMDAGLITIMDDLSVQGCEVLIMYLNFVA
jgi:hypothetical protein